MESSLFIIHPENEWCVCRPRSSLQLALSHNNYVAQGVSISITNNDENRIESPRCDWHCRVLPSARVDDDDDDDDDDVATAATMVQRSNIPHPLYDLDTN